MHKYVVQKRCWNESYKIELWKISPKISKFDFTSSKMKFLLWRKIKKSRLYTKMNLQKCNFEILYRTVSIKSIFFLWELYTIKWPVTLVSTTDSYKIILDRLCLTTWWTGILGTDLDSVWYSVGYLFQHFAAIIISLSICIPRWRFQEISSDPRRFR